MKTRPWPIVVLSIIYLVGPLFNTGISAFLMHLSWSEYMHRLFAYGSWWDWLTIVAMYPLASVAIYSMKSWSYPLYLTLMGIVTVSNLNDYVKYSQIFTTWAFVFTTFFNIALVSYFLLPAVRVAYFNKRMRWWESKPRYEVYIPFHFTAQHQDWKGTVANLSEGGAFVKSARRFKDGDIIQMHFALFNRPISVKAKVVYRAMEGLGGYGLQFMHTPDTSRQLSKVVKGLRLMGIAPRGGEVNYVQSFMDWSRGLTEGKGWVPEVPSKQFKTAKHKKEHGAHRRAARAA